MSDVYDSARESILGASDIGMADLEQTLGNLMTHSIDYGEVYLQAIRSARRVPDQTAGLLRRGLVRPASAATERRERERENQG